MTEAGVTRAQIKSVSTRQMPRAIPAEKRIDEGGNFRENPMGREDGDAECRNQHENGGKLSLVKAD